MNDNGAPGTPGRRQGPAMFRCPNACQLRGKPVRLKVANCEGDGTTILRYRKCEVCGYLAITREVIAA